MKCLGLFVGLFWMSAVNAQQSAQYSQYIRNQYMINPGAAGAEDFMSLTLGGRMQWTGFDDAPKTSYLYFSAPMDKMTRGRMKRTYGVLRGRNTRVKHPGMRIAGSTHAFGAQLLADQFGPFRTFKFAGTYAYHIALSRDYKLSFGVNAGLSSRSFLSNKAQVLSVMTNTGLYDASYASYVGNQSAQYTMDVEAGLYFYGKDVFAGFSANQLTGDLVKFGNRQTNFDPKIHYFLTGGYHFHINRKMKLTAATLLKYVHRAPLSVEVSVQGEFKDQFWFGASYRHKDAVVATFGWNSGKVLRIGYSFDFSISKLVRYNSGGHELVIGLMLGKSKGFAVKY